MGKDPITCRPADLIKPGMEDLRKKLAEKGLPTDDEHCVIYAMFPQQVEDFYKKPEPKEEAPGKHRSCRNACVCRAVHDRH